MAKIKEGELVIELSNSESNALYKILEAGMGDETDAIAYIYEIAKDLKVPPYFEIAGYDFTGSQALITFRKK